MKIKFSFAHTGTAGSAGVGNYTFSMPPGYTIDTSIMPVDTANASLAQGTAARSTNIPAGFGNFNDGGSLYGSALISPCTASDFFVFAEASGYVKLWGSGWYHMGSQNLSPQAEIEVPIV